MRMGGGEGAAFEMVKLNFNMGWPSDPSRVALRAATPPLTGPRRRQEPIGGSDKRMFEMVFRVTLSWSDRGIEANLKLAGT